MKFDNEFNEIKIRHAVIIYLLDMIIVIPILIFMMFKSGGEISGSSMNILFLLSTILLLLMLSYKLKLSKEKILILFNDLKNKISIKEMVRVIAFIILVNVGAATIMTDVMYLISPSFANNFIVDSDFTVNSLYDYIICFIISVVLSPIVDEIIFRNVLFKRLSKRFNVYVGVIVSSVIFSAINIRPEMIGTFALGVINCILYSKYENIFIPILTYGINNLFNILVPIPYIGFKNQAINMTFNEVVVSGILGIVLFNLGIIFFIKFINKNKIYLRECCR